ncbi:MAG: hypothetical protein JNJ45_05870 [Chthonomonas sp.]|nr:hypothetical protein [Chthonomonas sp.]
MSIEPFSRSLVITAQPFEPGERARQGSPRGTLAPIKAKIAVVAVTTNQLPLDLSDDHPAPQNPLVVGIGQGSIATRSISAKMTAPTNTGGWSVIYAQPTVKEVMFEGVSNLGSVPFQKAWQETDARAKAAKWLADRGITNLAETHFEPGQRYSLSADSLRVREIKRATYFLNGESAQLPINQQRMYLRYVRPRPLALLPYFGGNWSWGPDGLMYEEKEHNSLWESRILTR